MRKLILIKHASPQVEPLVPPELWALSDKGRGQCPGLAEAVRPYQPALFICSSERKAEETGRAVAELLGVTAASSPGLGEHDRSDVPHMPSREFISMMELFFRRPQERVLGAETADEATERFEKALAAQLDTHPQGNLAVVSHGTVIALFLARHGGGNGFQLWREMGLPSLAVIEIPGYRIETVVRKMPTRAADPKLMGASHQRRM